MKVFKIKDKGKDVYVTGSYGSTKEDIERTIEIAGNHYKKLDKNFKVESMRIKDVVYVMSSDQISIVDIEETDIEI